MPLITDFKTKKEVKAKFKKKEYRPWDLPSADIDKKPSDTGETADSEVKKSVQEHAKKKSEENNVSEVFLASSDLEKQWRSLYGAKKEVLLYLLQNIEESDENKVVTKNITLEQLAQDLHLPSNTVKGALYQLKKSNLLCTEEKKPGRGGYARYRILRSIFTFFETKANNK